MKEKETREHDKSEDELDLIREFLTVANSLTEKPDRAVRYVPLDKLLEHFLPRITK